jgi:hypothetical protein
VNLIDCLTIEAMMLNANNCCLYFSKKINDKIKERANIIIAIKVLAVFENCF